MKALFFGDVHFKKVDQNSSDAYNEWQNKVYDKTIESIHAYIERENPSHIFMLGDIIDEESVHDRELEYASKLFNFKSDAKKYLISGNHEQKLKNRHKYFWDSNVEFLKSFEIDYVKGTKHIKDIDALLVSHKDIRKLETYRKKHKFLLSHIRLQADKWGSEIDDRNLKVKFEQCVLSDLHSRLKIDNAIYTGAPLDTGFHLHASKPSVLLYDGEFKWLNTLTDKYRKKMIVFDSVEEFFSKQEEIENDYQQNHNWYKVRITDIKPNLKRLKPIEGITFDKIYKELESKDELQLIKETVNDLSSQSVEKGFIEYCDSQLDRKHLSDRLISNISNMEKEDE